MSEIVETVRVVSPVSDGNPHGYVVINRTDLTPEHEVFGAKPNVEEAKKVEEVKKVDLLTLKPQDKP